MKIQANDIHVWYLQDNEIISNEFLELYDKVLSDDERERKNRFHFSKHQHQFLLSRALIRFALSAYDTQVKPGEWQFEKNQYGKPSIMASMNSLSLNFNLSHTEQMIILAIAVNRELGVDVESRYRENTPLDIANSFFSDIEVSNLFSLSIDQQKERFFSLWTLKEAYIKARGMGLSLPLDQFSFMFPESGGIEVAFDSNINDQAKLWSFWHFSLLQEYFVSLAIKKQNTLITPVVTLCHALDILTK